MDDWDAPDGIDLNGPLPHHKIQILWKRAAAGSATLVAAKHPGEQPI